LGSKNSNHTYAGLELLLLDSYFISQIATIANKEFKNIIGELNYSL
jgi:hypothetical protein